MQSIHGFIKSFNNSIAAMYVSSCIFDVGLKLAWLNYKNYTVSSMAANTILNSNSKDSLSFATREVEIGKLNLEECWLSLELHLNPIETAST